MGIMTRDGTAYDITGKNAARNSALLVRHIAAGRGYHAESGRVPPATSTGRTINRISSRSPSSSNVWAAPAPVRMGA
jgi:hypothetical protein